MRGSFDFETYGWAAGETVNALCCALLWGPSSTWKDNSHFIHDESHKRPEDVVDTTLQKMLETREVTEWWAHNMGRFDALLLLTSALRLNWKVKGMLAGGGRIIGLEFTPPNTKRKVKCYDSINLTENHSRGERYHNDKPIRVYDSFNIVPSSLKKCAESFDLASRKQFTADDYKGDMRNKPVEALRDGCFADCQIVLELLDKVESLVEDWGGSLKKTFSSSSLNIVKENLLHNGQKLPELDHDLNREIEPGYMGARVEVLHHMPRGLLDEYDVNSSYPAAMAESIPWDFIGTTTDRDKLYWTVKEPENEAIIQAIATVPNTWLPCLPYRIPEALDDGIFFPTGTWEGMWALPEIRYAQEQGVTFKFKKAWLFTSKQPFSRFINEVYQTKQTAKGAVREFTKYLLNGCYGKFGEKPEHENLHVFHTEDEANDFVEEWDGGDCNYLFPGDQRFVSAIFVKWSKHTHFGIAGYITARARIALHRFLSESTEPAYCDSDSIHCKAWDGDASTALGGLKLELAQYRAEFFAPKIYRLTPEKGEQVLACKGFPVNAKDFQRMLDSAEDYHAGLRKEDRRGVYVERMRLLKSQLKGKGGAATKVLRIGQVKRWRGMSMKRFPFPDGSTRPWTVEELLNKRHKEAVSPIIKQLTKA